MAYSRAVALLLLAGLGMCSAQCPNFYTQIGDTCLAFLQDADVTWDEGVGRCATIGGRLATIDDCSMMTSIALYVNINGVEPRRGFWIGANDRDSEGVFKWIRDGSTVYPGMPFWGWNVGLYEPNGGVYQNCVAMSSTDHYYFHDFECDLTMGVICETDPTEKIKSEADDSTVEGTSTTTVAPVAGNCPNNSLAVDDKCFQFFPDGLETFYTAEVACLRANGELAIIESCQLLSDLASFIYENDINPPLPGGYWIGATDLDEEGTWRWIDQTRAPLGVPFWGKSVGIAEPNGGTVENCASLNDNDRYFMHSSLCTDRKGYLCQVEPIRA